MNDLPEPSPNMTPKELAHFHSLSALYQDLDTAIEDPATEPDAREDVLLPMASAAWQELTEMNALALHRDTFDLQAERQQLDPAIQQIQTLRAQLARYAHATNALLTVATVADAALSTATALGLDI